MTHFQVRKRSARTSSLSWPRRAERRAAMVRPFLLFESQRLFGHCRRMTHFQGLLPCEPQWTQAWSVIPFFTARGLQGLDEQLALLQAPWPRHVQIGHVVPTCRVAL